MRNIEQLIQEDVSGYQGLHQDLVLAAPKFYGLLTTILDDPDLPERLRPLLLVSIAYFVRPEDIVSEDLSGPRGYLDDIFLAAWVTNRVCCELGAPDIVQRSWTGEGSILALVERVLAEEKALIGDRLDLILWYIGSAFLPQS